MYKQSVILMFVSLFLVSCAQNQKKQKSEAEIRALMKDYVQSGKEFPGGIDFRRNKSKIHTPVVNSKANSVKTNTDIPIKKSQSSLLSTKKTNLAEAKILSSKNIDAQEGEKKLYDHFLYSVRAKDYKSANKAFKLLKKAYPNSGLLAEAHYQLALYALQNSKDKLALVHIAKILEKYPNSQRVPGALLNKAEIYQRMGLAEDAVQIFANIQKKYIGSTESLIAEQRLRMLQKPLVPQSEVGNIDAKQRKNINIK